MTETLHVRWKPGTLDTLLVTTPRGVVEWTARDFRRRFGPAAIADLYLRGRTAVSCEALPHQSFAQPVAGRVA
ncbi:hypothetical protein HNQ07_002050 [Deinococcus metalli]|uniref:Uncharacterized protein n=1 Tax=Deinococcus metalli TaxID=1141878 RepID=A0A7W8KEC1_9DEIO|nr:hypothetical protein [Deinococcus metalli]MBB5376586.1 hypothetical protein [Deinococcus metalli]GHF42964.1 hypothetical protein GCM10017781_19160 [Deinococcus metalli]